jgi:uncharacterized protein
MVLAAAATLAGASLQSATGFGFALVLSPAMFTVLPPYEAVTALLVLGFALNLLMLFGEGRPGPVRWAALRPMLLAALPGLAVGAAVLAVLPKPALQVTVGAAVMAAAILQALRRRARPRRKPSVVCACAVGLASGALTTSTSVSGPPIVLWLEAHGVRPAELRASLAASFLALNAGGGAALIAAGGADRMAEPALLVALLALTAAGHFAGVRLFRRLEGPRFRAAVLALVALAGISSVVAGAAAL